jgi:hypothetical protein
MLALLIPGVGMGASDPGGPPPGTGAGFLPIMGVGRAWWFFFPLCVMGLQHAL